MIQLLLHVSFKVDVYLNPATGAYVAMVVTDNGSAYQAIGSTPRHAIDNAFNSIGAVSS